MAPTADGRPSWNEDQIGPTLEAYFRREMPTELQRLPDAPWPVAATRPRRETIITRERPRVGRFGVAGLVTVAGALAVTLLAIIGPSPTPSVRHGGTLVHDPPSAPQGSPTGSADVPLVVDLTQPDYADGNVVVHERRETADGPVELRIEKRVENVRYTDPRTGIEVQMEVPEFDIEVFPIPEE